MVTKKLIKLAKLSPAHYAELIRKRNQKLLDALEQWHNNPEYLAGERISFTYGCPHCNVHFQCYGCLWTKINKRAKHYHCCDIQYNGVNFNDGVNNKYIDVEYGHSTCAVSFPYSSDYTDNYKEVEKEYIRAKKFLEGHIEWANLDCWGEKCED